jgi:hypothetical protein
MKPSIAMTLVVTAAIFSFVSGYSIGSHSDQAAGYRMANQSNGGSVATARAAENASKPSGGYGAPTSEEGSNSNAASPGYGDPSPGYGR